MVALHLRLSERKIYLKPTIIFIREYFWLSKSSSSPAFFLLLVVSIDLVKIKKKYGIHKNKPQNIVYITIQKDVQYLCV